MAYTSLSEWFNTEEIKMARPEKLFRIDLVIYDVPQSKLNDWLNDFANMEQDSSVTITEVDPLVEEETAQE